MMKNNKNKQNLVVFWTYECEWIDVEVDPQSQMKLMGLQMRMEFQVCQRVKYQSCRVMSTNWSNMERGIIIKILRKRIYMNKIRLSQAMSSGWNREERYMLKNDNMTRHIKFLSYWIKTTIPLFTFTITQKDTIADQEDSLLRST